MLALFIIHLIYWCPTESANINVSTYSSLLPPNDRLQARNTSIEMTLYYSEFIYYGIVGIGTPTQYFKLIFDTGSPHIWVTNVQHGPELQIVQNKYDPRASKTHKNTRRPYVLTYGNYITSGYIASDEIKLGQRKVETSVGVVHKVIGFTHQLGTIDGLFGLGPKQLYYQSDSTPLDDLFYRGVIPRRMFAFVFRGNWRDGTLILGDITKDHVPGNIHYVTLANKAETKGEWAISLHSIRFEYQMTLESGLIALVDTGTVKTLLPQNFVDRLFRRIQATPAQNGHQVPCEMIQSMPTLVFYLKGIPLLWEPHQYIIRASPSCCLLAIKAMEPGNRLDVILGMMFLRHFDTVFDVDNEKVGFADPV